MVAHSGFLSAFNLDAMEDNDATHRDLLAEESSTQDALGLSLISGRSRHASPNTPNSERTRGLKLQCEL